MVSVSTRGRSRQRRGGNVMASNVELSESETESEDNKPIRVCVVLLGVIPESTELQSYFWDRHSPPLTSSSRVGNG